MQTDYEHVLICLLSHQLDALFTVMLKTDDHFLEKKIQLFLHAIYFPVKEDKKAAHQHALIDYLYHALAVNDQKHVGNLE